VLSVTTAVVVLYSIENSVSEMTEVDLMVIVKVDVWEKAGAKLHIVICEDDSRMPQSA
jgi:hypothetical protein